MVCNEEQPEAAGLVCNEEQPATALDTFMKLLIPVTNKHTPIEKMTVKTVKSPWIDEELTNCMVERMSMANKSGSQVIDQHTAN